MEHLPIMTPEPMTVAYPRRGAAPSASVRKDALSAGNVRFAVAACASVLLHLVLLAAYDPGAPEQFLLSGAAPSRPLELTLRQLPASPEAAGKAAAEPIRTDSAPPVRATASGRLNTAAEKTEPSAPQSVSTAAPARAGDGASAADAAPRIDTEAARRLARQLARAESQTGARSARPPGPPALERETPLGRAIAASVRADCRTAYAGAGLFAIPSLIIDAVTDTGCRW